MILVYHASKAEAYADVLRKKGLDDQIQAASDYETARQWIAEATILFAWKFPKDLFVEAKRLRWVQWMGAGVEDVVNVIPQQVLLTRIVGQFGSMMAEYVFGWLLYKSLHIACYEQAKLNQSWAPQIHETLFGKTLCVAGLGSIGTEIVSMGRAFGMKVMGLSRSGSRQALVDKHFSPDRIVEFAAMADVIVVTLPYTPATRGMIGERVLAALKENAIFINIGRGQVVDEEALLKILQQNRIRAAILDVFKEEPLPEVHPFWKLPDVHVTPHIAGPSLVHEVSDFFMANLECYRQGLPLQGIVNAENKY